MCVASKKKEAEIKIQYLFQYSTVIRLKPNFCYKLLPLSPQVLWLFFSYFVLFFKRLLQYPQHLHSPRHNRESFLLKKYTRLITFIVVRGSQQLGLFMSIEYKFHVVFPSPVDLEF